MSPEQFNTAQTQLATMNTTMTNRTDRLSRLTETDAKTTLRTFLATQPPGPLASSARDAAIDLLAACWHELEGCDDAAMHNGKVRRAEKLAWTPPLLTFLIERHGGTVLGSTRAELQRWEIDLDRGVATWEQAGRRQVKAMRPRLNIQGLAQEVARHIVERTDHPALKWDAGRGRVHVSITAVIPMEGFKMTVESRCKRFKDALRQRLIPAVWQEVGSNIWKPVLIGGP